MACTYTWLAGVHAVHGHLEPPPEPEIPAEYAQKPRKRPAPETYLATPPLFTCAFSARSKRRSAALSEISPPNRERQRALNAVPHAISQNSRSPTRKSNRQTGTAEKARINTKEAPPVEDVLVAVEHVALWTQHVELNTTPRPTRQKQVAPPAQPIAYVNTRPAPVLTPSVSEQQANEDTEVESAHGTTTSKRSRSPTRRMVDLQIAKKPVVCKTAKSSTDVPQDVKLLYKTVQALARRSKGVIPLGIESELIQDSSGDLDDLDDYVARASNGKTHEALKDEFKAMRDIRNETSLCKMKHLHEPSWNELVHSRMLQQAVLGRSGFSYYNITTARVIRELVPGNEYGELLKSKMIDFVVTLGPPLVSTTNVINRITASPRKLQRTCNPSDYSPLCYEPIVLGIETKSPDGGNENGEVQLSVWAMACFNRLRQLIDDPVAVTLPLFLVVGDRWRLYFARDFAHEIHLTDAVDIGTTSDIIGCYTILKALRLIFDWVEEIYTPWFLEGLKLE